MNESHSVEAGSHEFQFTGAALVPVFGPTLAGFVGVVALLHLLNVLHWLPPYAPVESPDEVLMRRRFEMTRAPSAAEVVIIGDSSSAIDVEAPLLGELLPGKPEVLNQGMYMGIGMDIYGEAAGEFARHHPGQVKLVVLLITAEQLQNATMNPLHQRLWRDQLGAAGPDAGTSNWQRWLGLDAARDRVATHLAPFAFHGHASLYFAHPLHLRQHMRLHGGSTVDQGMYNPAAAAGPPNFRITDEVRREAKLLRAAIPTEVKLAVGITPLPDSDVPAAFRVRRDELLRELNDSLHADYLLTELPVRLPNGFAANSFHLNPRGAAHFTRLLAKELAKLPVWNDASGDRK